MTGFELSAHAQEQMERRGVSEKIVFEILANPDKIETEDSGQLIYQKTVLFGENQKYLVRVFVNTEKNPNLVKTVYRTSKFEKYK